MRFGHGLDDREADTHSAGTCPDGPARLREKFEHVWQQGGGDAEPIVVDRYDKFGSLGVHIQLDAAARRRVFLRINAEFPCVSLRTPRPGPTNLSRESGLEIAGAYGASTTLARIVKGVCTVAFTVTSGFVGGRRGA
ncbi:MAG TPA: hypothetical protein VHV99_15335 [Paraburkholderia sp.]|nr:hypothetical protein [Paraburkholderia sp.]